MPNKSERFAAYLREDNDNRQPVKLDMKIAPWEIVGHIAFCDGVKFRMEGSDRTYLVEDILHYRWA